MVDAQYPTVEEPATPEYVLSVIQDMHRQQSQYDTEADGEALLTFDTTVAEWREACDLLGWRELGRGLNAIWGIERPEAEWEARRTLVVEKRSSDVCGFVARRAIRPRIRAAHLLGRTCVTAGAFLTIRSLLHEAGADARGITPSTPLSPYTRRYSHMFLDPVSRMAPGSLPPVRVSTPFYDASTCGCVVGMLILIGGYCAGLTLLAIVGGAVFVLAYALTWIAARCLLPSSVEFGNLRTFRDLAVALSGSADV